MNHSFKIIVIPIFLTGLALCLTSCQPKPTLAVLTTTNVSGITQTSATSGGNVTSDGNAEVTSRGVCWNSSENPTVANSKTSDGSGVGSFTSSITQLTPGTNYYVRAYATNSEGTAYGSQVPFSSNPVVLATLTTTAATSVTSTTAVSGGNITSDGGGAIIARGVCWSTSLNPTTADNKTAEVVVTNAFTSNLTGLNASTTYYIRAYATNSAGTAYGGQETLITLSTIAPIIFNPNLSYGSVSDINGNVYKTIQIGTQTWMAENLKVTKYSDGTDIPNVTDNTAWEGLSSGAYCLNINQDAADLKRIYGLLYNWYAVNDSRKLCPTGWLVPSDAEWTTLTDYLGGLNAAASKLWETGNNHWLLPNPNTGATNESGFTALPGGRREGSCSFYEVGSGYSYWWTSTETEINSHYYGWFRQLIYINDFYSIAVWYENEHSGMSVRCLKD
jgi:uncharacterized protein (TIGR02145 family)